MSNSHIKKSDYIYTNLMIGTRPEIIKVSAIKKCKIYLMIGLVRYMTYFFLEKIFKINRVKFKEIFKKSE